MFTYVYVYVCELLFACLCLFLFMFVLRTDVKKSDIYCVGLRKRCAVILMGTGYLWTSFDGGRSELVS